MRCTHLRPLLKGRLLEFKGLYLVDVELDEVRVALHEQLCLSAVDAPAVHHAAHKAGTRTALHACPGGWVRQFQGKAMECGISR